MKGTAFPYVDARYDPPGKPKSRGRGWKRMLFTDVEKKIIIPSKNINCFHTVQWFKSGTPSKTLETHYCGLYFDFDARPEDYGGEVNAIEAAKQEVLKLVDFFHGHLEIPVPLIQVWYSGSKGFHVLINPESMGIRPGKHLTYVMKLASNSLCSKLDLKTLDMTVYSKRRMWRIPNSLHHTSKRFKTELYPRELHKTPEEIMTLAEHPREEPLYDSIEYESVKPEEEAVKWWRSFEKLYQDQEDLKNLKPTKQVIATEDLPVCVKDILENGLKRPSTRNKAVMALVSYFKDTGVSETDCTDTLVRWTRRVIPCNSQSLMADRIANAKAVTRTIYSNEGSSNFACQFILALSSDVNKIPCAGKKCKTIHEDPETQRPAEIPKVPLSRASEAMYIGKQVYIPVMITGKDDAPYDFPKKVSIRCKPAAESDLCSTCAIFDQGGTAEINFNMQDQELLDLINCTSSRRNTAIKRHAGVPTKCYALAMTIEEHGNLQQLQIQPNFTNSGLIDLRDSANSSLDTMEDGKHCVRAAYFVGHEIDINRKYDIIAYVWGHPRDQKIVHVFEDAIPAQDDIEQFKMTTGLYKMLCKFRPSRGQTIGEKFEEIHHDFEHNIHMIWGRREVAVALDLCYHSILGFSFQGQYEKKGWVELLILGDSGNGKTKLVERMMQHYQLGEITGVEGGKRTGLIWGNHNVGGRLMLVWGKIPQNDKRLIVLDEFSGMPDEEVAMMTRLRTEGIAEAQGINIAETTARTRMVFLSNARNGKPLDAHNYGVEAINALFREHQDVRRLDLAVCVKSGDVPLEVINKRHIPDLSTHRYTTDMCKKLVLWAWSRHPSQIKILPDSERAVLKASIDLGKKYRSNIVLVEPSDQRLKIIRIAAACAARMFSTNEEGTHVIVKPAHVDFAARFIQRCYDHPAMEYGIYAKEYQKRSIMDEDDKITLKQKWSKYRNHEQLRTLFLSGNYFRKNNLQDMSGYSKEEMKELLTFLAKGNLLESTSAGYRKTPMFTSFLKQFDRIGNTDPPF